ncbi:bifunctional (p)ppGpp synthetase/guanosine-3',5'-bis(diphosphate) 3'-pyrophosphohydrolase [Fervidibacter sacchari]|jgi:(p)ppGpp synthetase, RelA/SpoT family|uniref:GTP pyrophosphokinase n=1 Tax=Candidatus Fervidibacter sacchari TaxID=1448929 RepID=A0ABT2EN00_9BACT|nr:bifunctional (p)ppGpp synthetase/guanosine-3',5'-bis(diphosphate) 3'-pyrophosphohydrolase [Candidatus Fervidibacter sacchari]MCS3918298.1 GTP pyrophosphokinase [Candidatus Fervidibacter sacchari]WKU16096.1 bifunctional (p)ppGpp synthetase/guanosine-3',5'-bis(diphosphate) 3'-pyrophosphohydrolase [Candidatus Fervidibacter sacchari]
METATALLARQAERLGIVTEDGDPLTVLLERVKRIRPNANLELIEHAYHFADWAHSGQTRLSGEPYITHPWNVALIVADMGLDDPSIAAALLHDVVEDTEVEMATIVQEFGEEVARLVEGVTKLRRLQFHTFRQEQVENLRKVLVAMAQDVRVILIKLADRLHNLRTLDPLPEEKRKATALETLQIYAPIAHRLGIWRIKWELEDLAFKHLDPIAYRELARKVEKKRSERVHLIEKAIQQLQGALAEAGLEASVQGRPKHLWSIYQKMQREGVDIDRIYDLIALRVIVNTEAECYLALGVVHKLWAPLPGMFTDYIAKPKPNGYQSLHTKVVGPDGEIMEVQIRTWEMHRNAEYGIAAHWRYKEVGDEPQRKPDALDQALAWLRELMEMNQDIRDASEFTRSVIGDLFRDQVFVFTPKGDVIDLPKGSTPVDFAYRIHTEIGHRCIGAKVNGKLVPLDYQLQTGDVVEIITSKHPKGPSPDWLRFVKTSLARNRIKRYLKEQSYAENLQRGRELLAEALEKAGLSLGEVLESGKLDELAKAYQLQNANDLLAAIGWGSVSVQSVVNKLKPPAPKPRVTVVSPTEAVSLPTRKGTLLYRLAKCCTPVPNDPIVGYISRGRGIIVHRTDCRNIVRLQESEPERIVALDWGFPLSEPVMARLRVVAYDRIGLLSDVSNAISSKGVSIISNRSITKDGLAYFDLGIIVPDAKTLQSVIESIQRLTDVVQVTRIV